MENVPDMALGDDTLVLRRMLAALEEAGYETDARLVDTWLHGVPQHRQRLVVVGLREGGPFQWPESGEQVTLRDAISDLPVLDSADGSLGAPELPYDGPRSNFQRRARKDCLGDDANVIFDHVTRAVRSDDLAAFRLMKPGTLYSDLPAELRRYRADIFDDKYNRLAWDDLSRSITAHIAKDGYWYIHPSQHRTLTVREAARIQTFPDHFRFAGSRSHQFAQIGNAVPPALAEAVGAALLDAARTKRRSKAASPSRHRADYRSRMEVWAGRDRVRAPWAYPGDIWPVVVGQVVGGRGEVGWPGANEVLSIIPTWREATPTMLNAVETMADPGPRRKAVQRLGVVVAAVRSSAEGWEGDEWTRSSGIGPASREWIDLLGRASGMVASTSVLRVTARVTGTEVDRQNRLSNGRMELAKLIGDGDRAVMVNAAMHRLGLSVCTPDEPDCDRCPVLGLCASTSC